MLYQTDCETEISLQNINAKILINSITKQILCRLDIHVPVYEFQELTAITKHPIIQKKFSVWCVIGDILFFGYEPHELIQMYYKLIWDLYFSVCDSWLSLSLPVWPPPQSSVAAPPAPASASWTRQWSPDPALALWGTPWAPGFWTERRTEGQPSTESHLFQISTQKRKAQPEFGLEHNKILYYCIILFYRLSYNMEKYSFSLQILSVSTILFTMH